MVEVVGMEQGEGKKSREARGLAAESGQEWEEYFAGAARHAAKTLPEILAEIAVKQRSQQCCTRQLLMREAFRRREPRLMDVISSAFFSVSHSR